MDDFVDLLEDLVNGDSVFLLELQHLRDQGLHILPDHDVLREFELLALNVLVELLRAVDFHVEAPGNVSGDHFVEYDPNAPHVAEVGVLLVGEQLRGLVEHFILAGVLVDKLAEAEVR